MGLHLSSFLSRPKVSVDVPRVTIETVNDRRFLNWFRVRETKGKKKWLEEYTVFYFYNSYSKNHNEILNIL